MLTTWTTVAVLQAIFLVFLAAVSRAAAREALQPETSRKVLHTGAGLLTLVLPFAFRDLWPVVLLAVMTAAALAVIRLLPAMRMLFGAAAYRVGRSSYGEFYFLLAVVTLFWWTEGQSSLLFTIPVLILTLADTAGALVGSRYGRMRYGSAHKTVEGLDRIRRRRVSLRPGAATAVELRRSSRVVSDRRDACAPRDADRGQRLARARQPVDTHRRLRPASLLSAADCWNTGDLFHGGARAGSFHRVLCRLSEDGHAMDEVIEIAADAVDVSARCDRGVELAARDQRVRHSPDAVLVALRRGSLVARCSCWWRQTPLLDAHPVGMVGHYAAADRVAAASVLERACALLAANRMPSGGRTHRWQHLEAVSLCRRGFACPRLSFWSRTIPETGPLTGLHVDSRRSRHMPPRSRTNSPQMI